MLPAAFGDTCDIRLQAASMDLAVGYLVLNICQTSLIDCGGQNIHPSSGQRWWKFLDITIHLTERKTSKSWNNYLDKVDYCLNIDFPAFEMKQMDMESYPKLLNNSFLMKGFTLDLPRC